MKKHWLVYARKSSEAEDKQMASIESQLEETRKLTRQHDLNIMQQFSEAKSAKKPGRKEFNKMVEMIESRDDIKGIVCWKLNRLFRNPKDEGTIRWLLSSGKIEQIITPSKTYKEADSDFMMAVEGAQAQRFIRDLREDTKRGIDRKIENGIAPIMAPPGYRNNIEKKQGEKDISPHPIYFDLVREIFNLAMKNKFSVLQLHKKALDMGIKSNRDKPISRTQLYAILKNPFYTGRFVYGGHLYQGSHKRMVTDEEFELVQENLSTRSRPRGSTHEYALSGLVKCSCGYQLVGEYHRKKSGKEYTYYKCSQKNKQCNSPFVPTQDLEKEVYDFLGTLKLDARFVKWAIESVRDAEAQDRKIRNKKYKALETEYNGYISRIDNLTDKWLSPENEDKSLLSDDEYKLQKKRMFIAKDKVKHKLDRVDKDTDEWTDVAVETFKFAQKAQEKWQFGNIDEKKGILRVVGSSVLFKDGELSIEPRSPFLMIQSTGIELKNVREKAYSEGKKANSAQLHSIVGG